MDCWYHTLDSGGEFFVTMILDHRQGKINEDVRQSDYEIASFSGVSFGIPC